MTRFDPHPGTLRLLGSATLLTVLGLGVLASWIPAWQEPSMTRWTATIPVEEGARGLGPGGQVLVGGYPQGRIVSVDVDDGRQDVRGRPLIGITFELPSEIDLGVDAVIRRSVGIAGTNGVLDIPDPGSRSRRFPEGTPRVLAIDTSPPEGGSIGVLIGRRNGLRIQSIAAAGERLGERLPGRVRTVARLARELAEVTDATEGDLVQAFDHASQRAHRILLTLNALSEKAVAIPTLVMSLRQDFDALSSRVRESIRTWSVTIDRILLGSTDIRADVSVMSRHLGDLMPTIRRTEDDLASAVRDAEAARDRLDLLAPEVADGLRRTMARMVLAGGQLKHAINDLIPLAIEAITTTPDARSRSRRRLLESVNDTIESVADVRDAARRLDTLADLADDLPNGNPAFDVDAAAALDDRVATLERLLDALAARLQAEIEADTRR